MDAFCLHYILIDLLLDHTCTLSKWVMDRVCCSNAQHTCLWMLVCRESVPDGCAPCPFPRAPRHFVFVDKLGQGGCCVILAYCSLHSFAGLRISGHLVSPTNRFNSGAAFLDGMSDEMTSQRVCMVQKNCDSFSCHLVLNENQLG